MTAIVISAPVLPSTRLASTPSRTRLRLTVRGRRLLALLAALPAIVALGVAVIGSGTALASRDSGAPAGSFATLTVSAGDTLWSIAEEVAPLDDPRDVVDEIVRLNALDGVGLQAGQTISVPLEYSAAP